MDTGQHETACLARKTATILITALTLIMCRPLLSVGKCSYGRLAEFERSPIMARTQAGIQRAKERGVAFGRPTKLNAKQRRMIAERYRCRGDRGGARAPVRGGRGDCLAGAQWTLGPVFRYAFDLLLRLKCTKCGRQYADLQPSLGGNPIAGWWIAGRRSRD